MFALLVLTPFVVTLLKVLLFVGVLSVLIVLHEYGHFILARWNGVRVLEFSVGMGPLLWGTKSKRSGTQYSIRALPIGGYCAMHGEDNKTSEAEQQREFRETVIVNGREYDHDNFQAKSPWRRLGIVVAGPLANFILSFVILLAGAAIFGVQTDTVQPRVGPLVAGMPAKLAGLHFGDLILSVNGAPVQSGEQLVGMIHRSLHRPLLIAYEHEGQTRSVRVVPVSCPQDRKQGCIGFAPVPAYHRVSFGEALRESIYGYGVVAQQVVGGLVLIVSHPIAYGKDVSGVVGMGQAAVAYQDLGWAPYFNLAAIISFALGLFNLLPIPALDGGRGAFIVSELIRGKPMDPEKEAWVHITGFAVLIALMIVINFYNVVQIVQGKGPF